jgi:hypothetical protein
MERKAILKKTKMELVAFMGWAIIQGRLMCQTQKPIEQVGALLDAIHNFSGVIDRNNENEMEILIRDLEAYDEKWSKVPEKSLLAIFRRLITHKQPFSKV